MKKQTKMIEKKSWNDFRNSGLLWFVNTILHAFGWAIVFEYGDDKGEEVNVYPARVKFRGFDEHINNKGYLNIAKYMKENSEKILKELKS